MTLLGKSLRMLVGKRPPALQVGALCLRPRDGKVLMITSRGGRRWTAVAALVPYAVRQKDVARIAVAD